MYRGPIPQRCLALDYQSESVNENLEHCCDTMNDSLHNPDTMLSYSPRYREYFLLVLRENGTREQISALQGIFHCPWCNKKLPESTRDQWFDILEKDYQLEDPWDKEQENRIPNEFKTDEWWIKRKL